MHSWTFRLPPACLPPLMMFSMGTGRVTWSPPMCSYTGTPSAMAPALATARETATVALPPSLLLFSVPSSSIMASSTALWSVGSMPVILPAISVRMFSTALSTPLPPYLLPPSLSSRASHVPVDAPDGAMAVILCPLTVTSASTVGFPLESSTSLAQTFSICIGFNSSCKRTCHGAGCRGPCR